MDNDKRVAFLDYLRCVACLMVMVVHACENFYFGDDGGLFFASKGDMFWATLIDSSVRAAVPLFVMASSYLLFPLTRPTGVFFRRRLTRVLVPFAIWAAVYTWWSHGEWSQFLFIFPMATGGHLWFVPMLLGLYLLMPLLSPWAERASARELRGWIALWVFTTTFPFLRVLALKVLGEPSYGSVPFLYGECPWNSFGAFHYVSGFFGYLLLGLYARKFLPCLSWRATVRAALPLWIVGMAIVWYGFYGRIPFAGAYPVTGSYAQVVELERSWEFCGTGVLMTVVAYFLVLRKFDWRGALYRRVVLPISQASYGMYLIHMLILVPVTAWLRPHLGNPACIFAIAALTYALSAAIALCLRALPVAGKWLCG